MKQETIHHYIYLGSLLLLALATSLSNFLLSIGGILISVNWVLSGQWRKKWIRLKAQSAALWFSLFFVLCTITLLYASHLDIGIANLLNKLPLLYAPIILASSNPLNGKEQRSVLNIFLLGVFIGTTASYTHYFTQPVKDIREISVFISHIRFSLCLDLAVCLAIYLGLKVKTCSLPFKIGYLVLAVWFVIYLFFAQTLTGILILFALLLFAFFHIILKSKQIIGRKWIALACISAIMFFIGYSFMIVRNYYRPKDDETQLAHYTSRGNPYEHDFNSIVENGHKIRLYICPSELTETWNERSDKAYNANVEATLIRYLNSKGLRKDADGINALSKQDIQNVENGIANADYTCGLGVKRSLFPILFSFSMYQHYGQIEYSTILQRVELWKTGYAVCKEYFWFGVGLGDHKPELDKLLEEMNSPMTYKMNMGAHNQFVTYCMIGGIFLALYFIVILFLPFFKIKNSRHILFQLFFIIVFFSLLTEDTLESQVGVSLYAVFNSFLLFAFRPECCCTDEAPLFQICCAKRKR